MSRKKKRKQKPEETKPQKVSQYRKPISFNPGVLVFLVIFVYRVIMVISYFRQSHITPYEVKLGSLAINNTYKGVILRNEEVITSDFSGYINYYARESEKVKAFSMVYTVDSTGKLAEMVNDEIMRDTHGKLNEFALFFISSRLYRADYLQKSVLEYVISQLPVLDKHQHIRKNLILVTVNQ